MRSIAILLATLLLLAASCGRDREERTETPLDTVPEMVMRIQKCARLYTTECRVHKLVTHDDEATVRGRLLNRDYSVSLPFGRRKVAIPMEATVKAYVDLGALTADHIRRRGDKVEVVLPDPHFVVTATQIDHSQVRTYVPMLRRDFSDEELASYARQGREAIISEIPGMGLTARAQEDAARLLVPIIAQLGFREDDITVTFRKDFTAGEIATFIEKTDVEHGSTPQ